MLFKSGKPIKVIGVGWDASNELIIATVGGNKNRELILIDLDGYPKKILGHNRDITSIQISKNGEWIISGGDDGQVKQYNLITQEILTFDHGYIVNTLFIHEQSPIFVGGEDGVISQILNNTIQNTSFQTPSHDPCKKIMYDSEQRIIYCAVKSRLIYRMDQTDQTVLWFQYGSEMVAFRLFGKHLLTATGSNNRIEIWLDNQLIQVGWLTNYPITQLLWVHTKSISIDIPPRLLVGLENGELLELAIHNLE